MNELRIAYLPDDEWMGRVLVTVRSGAFAGHGEAWVSTLAIEEFAVALERYPLRADEPCLLEGGHGGSVDGSVAPQTLVSIAIKPHGARGALLVVLRLEDEIDHTQSRDAVRFQSVEARFLTDYNAVGKFVPKLRAIIEGGEDAVLGGVDW